MLATLNDRSGFLVLGSVLKLSFIIKKAGIIMIKLYKIVGYPIKKPHWQKESPLSLIGKAAVVLS